MPAAIGYAKGVPMGGDLSEAPKGKAPTFLAAALKDTIGANLDRIQIIKGWVDKDGKTQERIYDVAVSGGRTIETDGRCKTPVGTTVDVENATWTNTIGAPELITSGRTRTSTRRCGRSTTRACSRSRRRAGPPTTPSASA